MEQSTNKTVIDARIEDWEAKLRDALTYYDTKIQENDDNYATYKGTRDIYNSKGQKANKGKTTVRKVAFELVEAQIDTTIPQPKVTSITGNIDRAQVIEYYIKNELDRLPFEQINDEQERIVKITGSSLFLVEWDNSIRTKNTIGKLVVQNIHPNNIIPQKGVVKLDDMDNFFLRLLESKRQIKDRYGVDVEDSANTNPELEKTHNEELVTHNYVYYKNEDGYISLFSWVDNTIIQDIDNYFARKVKICTVCGKQKTDSEMCHECGNDKWKLETLTSEKLSIPTGEVDTNGQPVVEEISIDYYVPKRFPLVMIKNASDYDEFLGNSDVSAIKDQQNDLNILNTKIREKLLKGGSLVTIPKGLHFKATDDEMKIVEIENAAQKEMIDVKTLQPSINNDMVILDSTYEHARQIIGITDSFQGRRDTTAVSGKAKQFAAQQTSGRLESKRSMKNFAYSQLFELMFQFILAYADEPRYYSYQDDKGDLVYKMFDKRLFIDKDNAGNYYYDDEFIFSCDESAVLSTNRRVMWEETRNNFMAGAYGNPQDVNTIAMYWQMMDTLHYPGAKTALKFAMQRIQEAQQMAQQQMQNEQQNAETKMAVDAFGKINATKMTNMNR